MRLVIGFTSLTRNVIEFHQWPPTFMGMGSAAITKHTAATGQKPSNTLAD
jgi:hypothetical protein